MVRKIVLSLIAVLVLGAYAFAQNKQVSGTVSDANGNPVAGATVMVDGTSIGTTTNAAGQYSLSAPADGTLSVTFIGYVGQQLPIAGKSRIDVTMHEDTQAIDDVIVVAFGTSKRRRLPVPRPSSRRMTSQSRSSRTSPSRWPVRLPVSRYPTNRVNRVPTRSSASVDSVRSTPRKTPCGSWMELPTKET